jgi:hypothetical protein
VLRVGLIDVDTIHAWAIANYINATGQARVTAVCDHGTTWPRSHVHEFARRLGGVVVYDNPQDLLDISDAALFCGTAYHRRLDLAIPWLESGKPIYLDKPAVGTYRETRILEGYIRRGSRILCGSSLPWCTELNEVWRRVSRPTPVGLVVVGWRSLFEYGLHATDIALNLLQSRPMLVRWGVFGPTECVWVELENGHELAIHVGLETGPWQVTCLTADGVFTTSLDIRLYRGCHYDGLAQAFIRLALTGTTPVLPEWHIEGIKLLIAAKRSRDEQRVVSVDELSDDDGFNGRDYASSYRVLAQRSNLEAYLSPPIAELLRSRTKLGRGGFSSEVVGMTKQLCRTMLGERGVRLAKRILTAV